MIQPADIARLYAEIRSDDFDPSKWLRENDISLEAITDVGIAAREAIIGSHEEGAGANEALYHVICEIFMIGWEAHREYGGRNASSR